MVAVAAMMIAVSANAQDVNELIEKYNAAAELVNQQKYAEAGKSLEGIIREAAEYGDEGDEVGKGAKQLVAQSYYRAGMADARAKNFESAVTNFEKAISLGGKYGDAKSANDSKTRLSAVYSIMGAGAFNGKDYAKAIEIFAKGYEINPNDTKLALNLAKSYSENGDLEKGEEIYNSIIELGKQHTKYADAAAKATEDLAYYQTLDINKAIEAKDFAKANQMIDEVLKEDANNANVHYLLISVANLQQNWNKIISKGNAAAAAQTDAARKSDIYFFMGVAHQNSGNNDKAAENYKKVTLGKYAANAKTMLAGLN